MRSKNNLEVKAEERTYSSLFRGIFNLLLEKGLKSLTMDFVASSLSISKRTLYEKFVSKTDMVVKTMSFMADRRREVSEEIFKKGSNSLVSLLQVYYIQRNFICSVNKRFFDDMDYLFRDVKEYYKGESDKDCKYISGRFYNGVREGLFRDDVDYIRQVRILNLQFESLKRMEDKFPRNLTLEESFDVIYGNFINGIVTEKGRLLLDEISKEKELIVKEIEKYLYKNEQKN